MCLFLSLLSSKHQINCVQINFVMIWFIVILLMTTIGAFISYLKLTKSKEALYQTIDFGIRCAYVGLQAMLIIVGIAILVVLGWWLVG
jgi:hypothetical protein